MFGYSCCVKYWRKNIFFPKQVVWRFVLNSKVMPAKTLNLKPFFLFEAKMGFWVTAQKLICLNRRMWSIVKSKIPHEKIKGDTACFCSSLWIHRGLQLLLSRPYVTNKPVSHLTGSYLTALDSTACRRTQRSKLKAFFFFFCLCV